jgi:hypothetical protein
VVSLEDKKLIVQAVSRPAEDPQQLLVIQLVSIIKNFIANKLPTTAFDERVNNIVSQMTAETKRYACSRRFGTPFEVALQNRSTANGRHAARALLKLGVNIMPTKQRGPYGGEIGEWPWMTAARCGDVELIQEMIDGKFPLMEEVNWTARDQRGKTALHLAIQEGHYAMVLYLIMAGHPDPEPVFRTPGVLHFLLDTYLRPDQFKKTAKVLIENSYGLNELLGKEGFTTYQAAMMHKHFKIANAIRDHPNYCRTNQCWVDTVEEPLTDAEFARYIKANNIVLQKYNYAEFK